MKFTLAVLVIAQVVGITLKLSAVISWSWWIVLIPLWACLAFLAMFAVLVAKLPLRLFLVRQDS